MNTDTRPRSVIRPYRVIGRNPKGEVVDYVRDIDGNPLMFATLTGAKWKAEQCQQWNQTPGWTFEAGVE